MLTSAASPNMSAQRALRETRRWMGRSGCFPQCIISFAGVIAGLLFLVAAVSIGRGQDAANECVEYRDEADLVPVDVEDVPIRADRLHTFPASALASFRLLRLVPRHARDAASDSVDSELRSRRSANDADEDEGDAGSQLPILFVHGHRGSPSQANALATMADAYYFDQRRPLTAHGTRQRFVTYAADFGGASSAFDAASLAAQAHFVSAATATLLRRHPGARSVVGVGHSMGGVVLRLAAHTAPACGAGTGRGHALVDGVADAATSGGRAGCRVDTIITLNTPHQAHPYRVDAGIDALYAMLRAESSDASSSIHQRGSVAGAGGDAPYAAAQPVPVVIVSLTGGSPDNTVRPELTSLAGLVSAPPPPGAHGDELDVLPAAWGFSTSAQAVPGAWLQTGHEGVVNCGQLVASLVTALFAIQPALLRASPRHAPVDTRAEVGSSRVPGVAAADGRESDAGNAAYRARVLRHWLSDDEAQSAFFSSGIRPSVEQQGRVSAGADGPLPGAATTTAPSDGAAAASAVTQERRRSSGSALRHAKSSAVDGTRVCFALDSETVRGQTRPNLNRDRASLQVELVSRSRVAGFVDDGVEVQWRPPPSVADAARQSLHVLGECVPPQCVVSEAFSSSGVARRVARKPYVSLRLPDASLRNHLHSSWDRVALPEAARAMAGQSGWGGGGSVAETVADAADALLSAWASLVHDAVSGVTAVQEAAAASSGIGDVPLLRERRVGFERHSHDHVPTSGVGVPFRNVLWLSRGSVPLDLPAELEAATSRARPHSAAADAIPIIAVCTRAFGAAQAVTSATKPQGDADGAAGVAESGDSVDAAVRDAHVADVNFAWDSATCEAQEEGEADVEGDAVDAVLNMAGRAAASTAASRGAAATTGSAILASGPFVLAATARINARDDANDASVRDRLVSDGPPVMLRAGRATAVTTLPLESPPSPYSSYSLDVKHVVGASSASAAVDCSRPGFAVVAHYTSTARQSDDDADAHEEDATPQQLQRQLQDPMLWPPLCVGCESFFLRRTTASQARMMVDDDAPMPDAAASPDRKQSALLTTFSLSVHEIGSLERDWQQQQEHQQSLGEARNAGAADTRAAVVTIVADARCEYSVSMRVDRSAALGQWLQHHTPWAFAALMSLGLLLVAAVLRRDEDHCTDSGIDSGSVIGNASSRPTDGETVASTIAPSLNSLNAQRHSLVATMCSAAPALLCFVAALALVFPSLLTHSRPVEGSHALAQGSTQQRQRGLLHLGAIDGLSVHGGEAMHGVPLEWAQPQTSDVVLSYVAACGALCLAVTLALVTQASVVAPLVSCTTRYLLVGRHSRRPLSQIALGAVFSEHVLQWLYLNTYGKRQSELIAVQQSAVTSALSALQPVQSTTAPSTLSQALQWLPWPFGASTPMPSFDAQRVSPHSSMSCSVDEDRDDELGGGAAGDSSRGAGYAATDVSLPRPLVTAVGAVMTGEEAGRGTPVQDCAADGGEPVALVFGRRSRCESIDWDAVPSTPTRLTDSSRVPATKRDGASAVTATLRRKMMSGSARSLTQSSSHASLLLANGAFSLLPPRRKRKQSCVGDVGEDDVDVDDNAAITRSQSHRSVMATYARARGGREGMPNALPASLRLGTPEVGTQSEAAVPVGDITRQRGSDAPVAPRPRALSASAAPPSASLSPVHPTLQPLVTSPVTRGVGIGRVGAPSPLLLSSSERERIHFPASGAELPASNTIDVVTDVATGRVAPMAFVLPAPAPHAWAARMAASAFEGDDVAPSLSQRWGHPHAAASEATANQAERSESASCQTTGVYRRVDTMSKPRPTSLLMTRTLSLVVLAIALWSLLRAPWLLFIASTAAYLVDTSLCDAMDSFHLFLPSPNGSHSADAVGAMPTSSALRAAVALVASGIAALKAGAAIQSAEDAAASGWLILVAVSVWDVVTVVPLLSVLAATTPAVASVLQHVSGRWALLWVPQVEVTLKVTRSIVRSECVLPVAATLAAGFAMVSPAWTWNRARSLVAICRRLFRRFAVRVPQLTSVLSAVSHIVTSALYCKCTWQRHSDAALMRGELPLVAPLESSSSVARGGEGLLQRLAGALAYVARSMYGHPSSVVALAGALAFPLGYHSLFRLPPLTAATAACVLAMRLSQRRGRCPTREI